MEIQLASKRKLGFVEGSELRSTTYATYAVYLRKNGKPLVEYYTTLSALWEELEAMSDLPTITASTNDIKALMKAIQVQKNESRLFQFLNGLDETFGLQRSQLLMLPTLPSVETNSGGDREDNSNMVISHQQFEQLLKLVPGNMNAQNVQEELDTPFSELKAFGFLAVASPPGQVTDKFKTQAVPCIFVGYPACKKGFKLLTLSTMVPFVSIDVKFYEQIFPLNGINPTSYMKPDNPKSPRSLLLAEPGLKLCLDRNGGGERCSCRVGTYKTEPEGGGVPAAPPA
ncbi:hypothetical protein AgCh_026028 [Apium graveolens]